MNHAGILADGLVFSGGQKIVLDKLVQNGFPHGGFLDRPGVDKRLEDILAYPVIGVHQFGLDGVFYGTAADLSQKSPPRPAMI
jgi:hypothetical protein